MTLNDYARAIGEIIHDSNDIKDKAIALLGEELASTVSYSETQYGAIDAPWSHVVCPDEYSVDNDRIINVDIGVAVPREFDGTNQPVTETFNGIKTEKRYRDIAEIVSVILKVLRDTIPAGLAYQTASANGLQIIESGISFAESDNGADIYARIPLTIKQKNCKIGG